MDEFRFEQDLVRVLLREQHHCRPPLRVGEPSALSHFVN